MTVASWKAHTVQWKAKPEYEIGFDDSTGELLILQANAELHTLATLNYAKALDLAQRIMCFKTPAQTVLPQL